ncbi:hypothetical protein AVEN_40892-1 [Araneus ventricosus]|uniref:Uncharacterized protein n=1 Tax=Araneus ventricosus TaxID=182803 RepID=A0A4Y2MHF4_ARAVE|nr:hypothetical protein AVEN_40892-1 [Araneus ventricosus]
MVIRPPEGSRPWLSDLQRGRDKILHKVKWSEMKIFIRPPEGSGPFLSDLQRCRDHGYQTSRGVATMAIRPPEGSRQNFTQSEVVGNENILRTTALLHLVYQEYLTPNFPESEQRSAPVSSNSLGSTVLRMQRSSGQTPLDLELSNLVQI